MQSIGETLTDPGRLTPRHIKKPLIQRTVKKLTILIPCYNESATIAIILDKIMDLHLYNNIEKEVVVINDCSTDDTHLIIEEYLEDNPNSGIKYIRHQTNQGKGAAVNSGLALASGEYAIIQDADLEYNPAEYDLLLRPILSGNADIVYGSRFMGGNPHRILFFWHTIGNKLLTLFSNIFTNMNLTDAHTCYKLIPISILRQLALEEKRFSFDAELNVKISLLKNIRLYEVGISYYGRTFAEGKKIRLRDALRSVYSILKYSFFRNSLAKQPACTLSSAD
jgi:glycosyltransferase involved in cell wall biosynthesis